MANEPVVQITLTDVYVKLCHLEDKVAEMTPQADSIKDHETRIRAVERWKYAFPVSLVVVFGEAVALIVKK